MAVQNPVDALQMDSVGRAHESITVPIETKGHKRPWFWAADERAKSSGRLKVRAVAPDVWSSNYAKQD